MPKFRIVRDRFAGYEVQHKYRWWPFWIQSNCTNTHFSVEAAESFARRYAEKIRSRGVVKYLGEI